MKARIHPLLVLLSILLISITLGIFGALFFYHRDEQQILEEYRRTKIAALLEFDASGPWYIFVGIGLGLLVGLAVGISAYLAIKRRTQEEQRSVLNLTRRQRPPATHI